MNVLYDTLIMALRCRAWAPSTPSPILFWNAANEKPRRSWEAEALIVRS